MNRKVVGQASRLRFGCAEGSRQETSRLVPACRRFAIDKQLDPLRSNLPLLIRRHSVVLLQEQKGFPPPTRRLDGDVIVMRVGNDLECLRPGVGVKQPAAKLHWNYLVQFGKNNLDPPPV